MTSVNNFHDVDFDKIEEKSLAHRQGEFQRDDQIIQINNQAVFNREQAIELIQGVSLLIFQIVRFQVHTSISILQNFHLISPFGTLVQRN